MINVGIGKIANSGFGYAAKINTMLRIDNGAMNIPMKKRALLRTNKVFLPAFVIPIPFCDESMKFFGTASGKNILALRNYKKPEDLEVIAIHINSTHRRVKRVS
jgi:hypothetical protein